VVAVLVLVLVLELCHNFHHRYHQYYITTTINHHMRNSISDRMTIVNMIAHNNYNDDDDSMVCIIHCRTVRCHPVVGLPLPNMIVVMVKIIVVIAIMIGIVKLTM
jgi:hypothetical protein